MLYCEVLILSALSFDMRLFQIYTEKAFGFV